MKSDLDVKITRSERNRDLTNRRYERWQFGDEVEKIRLLCACKFPWKPGRSKTTDGMGRSNGSVASFGLMLGDLVGGTHG